MCVLCVLTGLRDHGVSRVVAAPHERFDVPGLESVCHLFVCVLCVLTGLSDHGVSRVVDGCLS